MIDTDPRKLKILHIAEGIGVDVHTFFMMCYMWRFQKKETVQNDYILFIKLGVIPSYVEDFLNECEKHIDEKTQEG